MIKNQLVKSTAIAVSFICLFAATRPARADGPPHSALQTPKASAPMVRQNQNSLSKDDDFAGLDLTDEQKAEMAKIRQDTDGRKALVAKDTKLSPDQKDAFILGYTRLEYGQMFRVLNPAQKKEVTKRLQARRAAEQAQQKKKPQAPQH